MRITYPKAIQESEEDLRELEQRLRGQKAADRMRMLRLLKSGTVKSMRVLRTTGWLQCDPADPASGNATGEQAWQSCSSSRSQSGRPAKSRPRRGRACWPRCERDTWQPWRMRVSIPEREWGIRYKNGKSLWWLFKKHRLLVEDRTPTP